MEKFLTIVVDLLETEDELTANTEYADLENWDSLTIVSLLAAVNIEYNKTLHMADFKGTKTLGEIFDVIKRAHEDK